MKIKLTLIDGRKIDRKMEYLYGKMATSDYNNGQVKIEFPHLSFLHLIESSGDIPLSYYSCEIVKQH